MIQPKLFAQLGNQCFMISAVIAHAIKMGTTYSIPKKTINPRIWKTYFNHLPEIKSATKHYYKEDISQAFHPLPELNDLTIEGYFQSEKHWNGYKKEIADALAFNPWRKSAHYDDVHVALHIRRGDYLLYKDQFPVLPIDYYQEAICYFINKGIDVFRIYTDDIPYIENVFNKKIEWCGSKYFICTEKDPLSAMKALFTADSFIVANSTFSLFPALLREDNPPVVAPAEDRWYGPMNKHLATEHLMPERFIKL